MKKTIHIGVVTDFPEERWESMDLVAEMTLMHLRKGQYAHIVADVITPSYRKIFQSVFTHGKWAWNLDRLINRRIILSQAVLRSLKSKQYDVIYIVDHSYGHLVNIIKNAFPKIPVVIMCHDLDAVTVLDAPCHGISIKKRLLRWFSRPILDGLLNANQIITGSDTVRDSVLMKYNSRIRPLQLMTNPYGIATEFHANCEDMKPNMDVNVGPVVLHVGSVIPRKRIDVLLKSVAIMAIKFEDLQLIRIGGDFTTEQKEMLRSLGLVDRVRVMPRLTRLEVADWYRRSDVVLITSEAEGFGLPVIEALACGASVVASDIPVLRETGGEFARYAPVGNAEGFAGLAVEQIEESGKRGGQGGADDGLRSHLERYQWKLHMERLVEVLEKEACLKATR
jgi:glycosyltransferase involved in cell wall biosynthesis